MALSIVRRRRYVWQISLVVFSTRNVVWELFDQRGHLLAESSKASDQKIFATAEHAAHDAMRVLRALLAGEPVEGAKPLRLKASPLPSTPEQDEKEC